MHLELKVYTKLNSLTPEFQVRLTIIENINYVIYEYKVGFKDESW